MIYGKTGRYMVILICAVLMISGLCGCSSAIFRNAGQFDGDVFVFSENGHRYTEAPEGRYMFEADQMIGSAEKGKKIVYGIKSDEERNFLYISDTENLIREGEGALYISENIEIPAGGELTGIYAKNARDLTFFGKDSDTMDILAGLPGYGSSNAIYKADEYRDKIIYMYSCYDGCPVSAQCTGCLVRLGAGWAYACIPEGKDTPEDENGIIHGKIISDRELQDVFSKLF